MQKIYSEKNLIKGKYSIGIINNIKEVLNIFNENYGAERNIEADLGGYVVIAENIVDIEILKQDKLKGLVAEYTDIIECSEGVNWTSSLFLLSSDFSIVVITTARETMKGLKENAYKCKHTGGLAPLGYDVNSDKRYIINEREAESVRLIFDMYISGYTQSEMVNELNARGFKTKVGAIFRANSIHSVLTNEKYTGVYIYNKSAKKDAFGKRNSHKYKDESEIIRIEGGMPQIISKETFAQAQEVLKARKRAPGTNKAKENYLLAGVIRCGCCGKHYQGNRRNAKNKPMYVSYRCSYRRATSSKICDNKEIRKEYIEEYVLSELERKIFNDKSISYLVEDINKNLQKQNKVDDEKREVIIKELKEIDTQIGNIVTAIASGFMQEEFKTKMEELKNKKSDLEYKMTQLESKDMTQIITEEDVRSLLNNFSGYVISRNIPECKKFIQDFVKEVVVYKEHIEVIFNVSFSLFKKCGGIEGVSRIKRYKLYERYSQSFYIRVN